MNLTSHRECLVNISFDGAKNTSAAHLDVGYVIKNHIVQTVRL